MEILVFLVVIIVLILVHELGHFIVAKLSGMRVDEFGFGYPPRALTMGKIGDTEYTLNWLPFGGFVRIYGEDGDEKNVPYAFAAKPRILQALTLIAGIAMNVIFAYILFTITLGIGTLQTLTQDQIPNTKDAVIAFSEVRPGSIAEKAGFKAGDEIKNATIIEGAIGIGYPGNNPLGLTTLISSDTNGYPIQFQVERDGKMLTITATPKTGVIAGEPNRPGLGVVVTAVGTVKTPWKQAITQGFTYTWHVTEATAVGLYEFLKSVVLFRANLSEVTGPIGIANAVGQASSNGVAALLSLTALISINLALINLLPLPALDGGRLLFVIIEAIIRRPINPKIADRVNMIGFGLLILLMLVVSGHDIFTLIHH